MVNLIDDKCIIINSICIDTAQIEKGNILKLSCKKVSKRPKGVDFLKLVLLLSEVNPTHKLIHSSSDYQMCCIILSPLKSVELTSNNIKDQDCGTLCLIQSLNLTV